LRSGVIIFQDDFNKRYHCLDGDPGTSCQHGGFWQPELRTKCSCQTSIMLFFKNDSSTSCCQLRDL
jgi:hypothetical protein